MSSRLDPTEYDLGELRAAVRWARLDRTADGDRPTDSRSGTDADTTVDAESDAPGVDADTTADVGSDGRDAGEQPADRRMGRTEESARESRRDGAPDRDLGSRRGFAAGAGPAPDSWRRGTDRRAWPLSRYDHVGGTEPDTAGGEPGECTGDGALLGTAGPPADVDVLARLSGDVDRPYLERLPDGYGTQRWVLAWLEGLLSTAGRKGAGEALAHYEALGWLSTTCREHLAAFLDGLEVPEPDASVRLTPDHHRESLRVVAWLAQGTRPAGRAGGDRSGP